MKVFQTLATAALFGAALLTTAVAQDLPKPLGIPLGATMEEAKKGLLGTPVRELGINRYSNGLVLSAAGSGLGVEGLREVVLIFDKDARLTALRMTLGKNDFNRVLGHLRKQYPLTSSKTPFVGDQEAVFETKDARIEMEAPHMGFDTSVAYMTKTFYEAFQRISEADRKAKLQSEGTRF